MLREYPERERSLWAATSRFRFEDGIAARHLSLDNLFELFDARALLTTLANRNVPREETLDHLLKQGFIFDDLQGGYDATNVFALLAGRDLSCFPSVANKAPRVIQYKTSKKLYGIGDVTGQLGYGLGFLKMLKFIMGRMPYTEEMESGIRVNRYPVPEIAIRELVANALIHQDFTQPGHPTIEIFEDKIQITNPGEPLVDPNRFIDSPSRTRNERLAHVMRQLGMCEERGSGIDRALDAIENEALPAPVFRSVSGSTVAIVFRPREFAGMSKEDRIRACYQHACLRLEANQPMSNASLRKRLGLSDRQYPQVSLVIRDTIDAQLIRPLDEDQAKRTARYLPFYA